MHITTIHHSEHAQGVDLEQYIVIHHNGDYSGDAWFVISAGDLDFFGNKRVEFNDNSWGADSYTVRIPFDVLLELVGRYIAEGKMSLIKGMSGKELISTIDYRP